MKKIGLALGGGAVLGASHVGTLRALDEMNIQIDCVAGTSIGAFVGVFHAFGVPWKELEALASKLNWIDITGIALSRYGLLSNDKIGQFVVDHIGDKKLEDANIPIALVATDVSNGERVVLNKGSVAKAVMASTCIPGIFQPVELDGLMLVDGGVVENVPVRTLKEFKPDLTIGVDLNAKHSYGMPANILDVLLNSFHFMMKQAVKLSINEADVLIEPDLSAFSRSDIRQVKQLMNKGYADSKEILSSSSLAIG